MRVLVVEEEPRLASLISRCLQHGGHVISTVDNGEHALELTRAADYDAIVLDVGLPGIDGFETCRRLREGGVATPA